MFKQTHSLLQPAVILLWLHFLLVWQSLFYGVLSFLIKPFVILVKSLRSGIGHSSEKPHFCAKSLYHQTSVRIRPCYVLCEWVAYLLPFLTCSSGFPHCLNISKMLEQLCWEKPGAQSTYLQNTSLHLFQQEKELTFKFCIALGLE